MVFVCLFYAAINFFFVQIVSKYINIAGRHYHLIIMYENIISKV